MNLAQPWTRLITACLAVILALALAAPPGRAQGNTTTITTTTQETTAATIQVSEIQFPATVTRIAPGTVTVNCAGTMIELPSQFATFSMNGRMLGADALAPGQGVTVVYPAFTATVNALHDNTVVVRSREGRLLMIPVSSLTPAMRAERVFVRLSDGTYVQTPLRTAIDLQNTRGATVIASLPPGATFSPYAAADEDVTAPDVRSTNWSEDVRIQQDESKIIIDQSIDGDSNF